MLEGHETFEREFRGEVLQPSTAHLLDELGLLEYILAAAALAPRPAKVRLNGREVGEFSFKKISPEYPYAIWMPQPIFLAALVRKAEPLPTSSAGWARRSPSSFRRTAASSASAACATAPSRSRFVPTSSSAPTGAIRAIAKLGGFTAEYEHHDFDIVWFTIEQPPGWSSTFYISFGDKVRGLMLPKYPHHIQAGIALPTGGVEAVAPGRRVAFVADRVRQFDPSSPSSPTG